mmetsp:Transcript_15029/g.26122  ORF Transcript_15029/g.26122 Transcript_15029/m.26122 type:complete len:353 (-) Transcript_15029:369-1427(-)
MVTTRSHDSAKLKALVSGGAGFLGQHLVQQLLDTGKYEVVIFDIRDTGKCLAPVIVGDLRKLDQVIDAIKGVDVVFHCATAAPTSENSLNNELMFSVNVEGARNVVKACQINKVTRLVFTSSASVVFQGKALVYVTEDHPYATKPMDYYTQTKILAEQVVLAANAKEGLMTVALRPSAIFGENDPIMVPTVVKQAKAGKMKFIIGDGKNEIDWTYVGNVAQAHLDAADALAGSRSSQVAGKAFFITNQEPRQFWTMMGDVCEGLNYSRPYIHLPFALIIFIAMLFEYVIRPLLKPIKTLNSDFTVNRILIATTNRTFSSQAAKEHLGYQPKVNMDEALKRTLLSFEHLRKTA